MTRGTAALCQARPTPDKTALVTFEAAQGRWKQIRRVLDPARNSYMQKLQDGAAIGERAALDRRLLQIEYQYDFPEYDDADGEAVLTLKIRNAQERARASAAAVMAAKKQEFISLVCDDLML